MWWGLVLQNIYERITKALVSLHMHMQTQNLVMLTCNALKLVDVLRKHLEAMGDPACGNVMLKGFDQVLM